MDSVGVCVCTFGDKTKWEKLALRALDSVNRQTRKADEVIWYHGKDLQEARNTAVAMTNSQWIVILDADDLLDEKYIEDMLEASKQGTLLYPRVQKVYPDGLKLFVEYKCCNLMERNFIVIGAMFQREDFLKVGGFSDEPIWDDWSLWLRLKEKLGVIIVPSKAVYIAYENPNGRNHRQDVDYEYWLNEIRRRAT